MSKTKSNRFGRFIASLAMFATVNFTVFSIAGPTPARAQESSDRKVVERVEPAMPPLAQHNGLSGTVKLRVLIGPDGKPKKVEVLGGNPVFVENAADSVKKWKWTSADHESTELVQLNFTPHN
jgi:TonB family protein